MHSGTDANRDYPADRRAVPASSQQRVCVRVPRPAHVGVLSARRRSDATLPRSSDRSACGWELRGRYVQRESNVACCKSLCSLELL